MSTSVNIKNVEILNRKFINILENPYVKYGFLIILILKIIFITKMSDAYLEVYDYTSIKIIYALLVAYSACFDPLYAVGLTTLIIISIQELYSRRANNAVKSQQKQSTNDILNTITNTIPNNIPSKNQEAESINKILLLHGSFINKSKTLLTNKLLSQQEGLTVNNIKPNMQSHIVRPPISAIMENNEMPNQTVLDNDANTYNLINKHTLQRIPSQNDILITEYDYYEDPAYHTLTANIKDDSYLARNRFLITNKDLAKIQTNREPNVNKNISIQPFHKTLNIQGCQI